MIATVPNFDDLKRILEKKEDIRTFSDSRFLPIEWAKITTKTGFRMEMTTPLFDLGGGIYGLS